MSVAATPAANGPSWMLRLRAKGSSGILGLQGLAPPCTVGFSYRTEPLGGLSQGQAWCGGHTTLCFRYPLSWAGYERVLGLRPGAMAEVLEAV